MEASAKMLAKETLFMVKQLPCYSCAGNCCDVCDKRNPRRKRNSPPVESGGNTPLTRWATSPVAYGRSPGCGSKVSARLPVLLNRSNKTVAYRTKPHRYSRGVGCVSGSLIGSTRHIPFYASTPLYGAGQRPFASATKQAPESQVNQEYDAE